MSPDPRPALLAFAAALLLTGCGGADDPGGATPRSPQQSTTVDAVDPEVAGPAEKAVEDLSSRLDVPVDQITIVSAEQVTWGDTSLGCPQPGMRYAQVVQDGTYIELEHGGTIYPYHSGGERPDPFLCEHVPAPDDRITDPAY